jgi:hypothetical protein
MIGLRRSLCGPALRAAFALAVLSSGAAARADGDGGHVLPPDARPHGYSLAKMAQLVGQFTTSNNNPTYYPNTPFQILFQDPATETSTPVAGGVVQTGRNVFNVAPGTMFYVPVGNADDSPPFVPGFPSAPGPAAVHYFFSPKYNGGKNFAIIVDGESTELGPDYLAGPVTTPPLLDGGGTHIITLGAFLSPLKKGVHTVTIQGGFFGAPLQSTFGIAFETFSITYFVNVGP